MCFHSLKQNTVKLRERERERESLRNRVNMRNRETWFENSGGGFIHSSAHLRDGDREREIVHKADRSRDGGRENEVPLARYHQIVGTTIGKAYWRKPTLL